MDHGSAPQGRHPIGARRWAWLADEVRTWEAEGLLDPRQVDAVLGRYAPSRRIGVGRLLLHLGAVFVGIGVVWLVAANLERMPAWLGLALVTALWGVVVVSAHLLARHRERQGREAASPVVGALQGLAALGLGAVVLQAAQALEVEAGQPGVVACWAVGALGHAYLVRGLVPLVVGAVTGTYATTWHLWGTAGEDLGVVLGLLLAGTVATSLGTLHARSRPSAFAATWRSVGGVVVLAGLFIAAIPELGLEQARPGAALVVAVALTAGVVLTALVLGRGRARWEGVAAAGATAAGTALLWWPRDGAGAEVTASDVAQAVTSVLAYVLVAGGVAALGILRDVPFLTWSALAALVLFTTFQAFAVFSTIMTGAWLFVVLGLALAASGVGFDRARRRLEAGLEPARVG